MLKWRDTYYQMYSGGWFGDGTYAIGFATAPSHRGPWRKYAENPIFRSTQQVVGPGHHCVTVAPTAPLFTSCTMRTCRVCAAVRCTSTVCTG